MAERKNTMLWSSYIKTLHGPGMQTGNAKHCITKSLFIVETRGGLFCLSLRLHDRGSYFGTEKSSFSCLFSQSKIMPKNPFSVMIFFFYPLLEKLCPLFKHFAQLGSILSRQQFILPTLLQARKGLFWGGVRGV